MTFRIGICDDEIDVCASIETMIEGYAIKTGEQFYMDVFYSGESLLRQFEQGIMYDLIFLDIEMPGISGIDLGSMLRVKYQNELTKIVYMSWMSQYALDLFQVRPLDFLVKPFTKERVIANIDKAQELLTNQTQFFIYKIEKNFHKLPVYQIRYFKSDNRLIVIHSTEGDISFYDKLEKVEDRLDNTYFWRIHKSYIVNYQHISVFEYKRIYLDDGTELPISQAFRKNIRERHQKLIIKGVIS